MWLVHQFKPLLELASCKEYVMARKTIENSSSGRNKPKAVSPPSPISVVPETRKNVVPISMEDEIRRRAYEIYLERGDVDGDQNDDWITAEREVRARYQQPGKTA
jgi:DUF2934 family protein